MQASVHNSIIMWNSVVTSAIFLYCWCRWPEDCQAYLKTNWKRRHQSEAADGAVQYMCCSFIGLPINPFWNPWPTKSLLEFTVQCSHAELDMCFCSLAAKQDMIRFSLQKKRCVEETQLLEFEMVNMHSWILPVKGDYTKAESSRAVTRGAD